MGLFYTIFDIENIFSLLYDHHRELITYNQNRFFIVAFLNNNIQNTPKHTFGMDFFSFSFIIFEIYLSVVISCRMLGLREEKKTTFFTLICFILLSLQMCIIYCLFFLIKWNLNNIPSDLQHFFLQLFRKVVCLLSKL